MATPITPRQLSKVLKDNEWHHFGAKSSCTTPGCVNCNSERMFVRVRSDGRLLTIKEEDASEWYGIETGSGDTSKLSIAGRIEAKSSTIKHSQGICKPFNSCGAETLGNNSNTESCGHSKEISEQEGTQTTINCDNQEQNSKRTTSEPHEITDVQIQQVKSGQRVQPPCHCQSCSTLFWFPKKAQSSLVLLEREKAAADVYSWVQNAIEKSTKIAQGLKQYEPVLRKRWEKKFASTKKQHAKLLHDVQASLEEQGSGIEVHEVNIFTRNKAFGRNARCRVLTTALISDSLFEDSTSLFRQFKTRSEHPSQSFYSDLHCMYSIGNNLLSRRFVPGAFNITPASYGAWQVWRDHEVHCFQTVAASVSMLVFESQSEILNVLWEIFQRLAYGLSFSDDVFTHQNEQEPEEALELVPLPTFTESQSIYTHFPSRIFSFQDVHQLCNDQLTRAVTELTSLRRSRKALDSRTETSKELHKATLSCEFGIPHQVIVEPYERVLWWLFIVEEAQALLHVSDALREDNNIAARSAYLKKVQSLMITLRLRSDQVLRIAVSMNLDDATTGVVVPASAIRVWGSAEKFVYQFAFSEPLWISRVGNRISCKGNLKYVVNDLSRVHPLVQEWCNEGMLITRIEEILMKCEPTILCHKIEPVHHDNHVRQKLYSSSSSPKDETLSFARDAVLDTLVPIAGEQIESAAAALSLSEIWEQYQEISLLYYQSQGFKEDWLEKVEDVWVCSDPGEVVPAKSRGPVTPRNRKTSALAAFHTNIPHQTGQERVSARKLTLKMRARLSPAATDKSPVLAVRGKQDAYHAESVDDNGVQIEVCQASLNIAELLFSNAQVNTKSVRWKVFCNFMVDTGCEIDGSGSGGASTRFLWVHPVEGKQKTMTLHKPHPVPILEPQMLRNVHTTVRNAFGWKKEYFVERKST